MIQANDIRALRSAAPDYDEAPMSIGMILPTLRIRRGNHAAHALLLTAFCRLLTMNP